MVNDVHKPKSTNYPAQLTSQASPPPCKNHQINNNHTITTNTLKDRQILVIKKITTKKTHTKTNTNSQIPTTTAKDRQVPIIPNNNTNKKKKQQKQATPPKTRTSPKTKITHEKQPIDEVEELTRYLLRTPTGADFNPTATGELARAVKALIAADLKREEKTHIRDWRAPKEERAPKTKIRPTPTPKKTHTSPSIDQQVPVISDKNKKKKKTASDPTKNENDPRDKTTNC